jgi:hypothetical protein
MGRSIKKNYKIICNITNYNLTYFRSSRLDDDLAVVGMSLHVSFKDPARGYLDITLLMC